MSTQIDRAVRRARRVSSIVSSAALAATAVLAANGSANAADLYWDANGATTNAGGTGSWLTPSNVDNWRDGSTIGTLQEWVDGNTAVFAGSVGTVTVDGA